MIIKKKYLLPTILILCAFIAGHSLRKIMYPIQSLQHTTTPLPKPSLIGAYRPDFELMDLEYRTRHIREWDGRVRIINFWATWCPPCRKEIPEFINLQTEYQNQNLQMLGIAIDNLESVIKFTSEHSINYPILYGQQEASAISKAYGNHVGALPYTVFVDANGIIRYIHDQGELTSEAVKNILKNL